jgi:hypothetical protein
MKTNDSKQKKRHTKASAAYLAAKAAEAEKQSEAARKLARLAKAKFKDARKAFKQAKKLAKQIRKEAKASAKALKEQITRARKAPKKKAPVPAVNKVARSAASPKPLKRAKLVAPSGAPTRDAVTPATNSGSDIIQP